MTTSKPISYDHGARIAERARQNNAWNQPAASEAQSTLHLDDNSAPMREATIILPTKDNDGHFVAAAHSILTEALLDDFGGYTEETVRGAWMDNGKVYHDESIRYTVAAPASSLNQNYLEEAARNAASDAKQLCIYVRGFDGIVRMIEPT